MVDDVIILWSLFSRVIFRFPACALSGSGVDLSDVVKKTSLDVEDLLVMETKLKIIEILQVFLLFW